MAQPDGATDWKPLSAFPEFADVLAAQRPAPGAAAASEPPPVVTPVDAIALANEILSRDYTLDIGACFSRAWAKVMSDFWPIIGVSAVILLILGFSSVVAIVVAGPLISGLFWYYLKSIRGQRAEMGDAFAGFTLVFLQSFLGVLVSGLLTHIGIIFCILPGIYLVVAWQFTLPLIIDKRLGFWDAMELSRKVITKHWWGFCGLWLLSILLSFVGILCLCVGWFVTTPVTMMALMYAYEDIFGRRPGAAA
jgi:hypothetical protein